MTISATSPAIDDPAFADVYDEKLIRPGGRIVAWTRSGAAGDEPGGGIPVVRMPGTPGSRWALRSDRSGWVARNVEVITTERPGFGRSTRLPGRGFAQHADDIAAVLDHLGIERARVLGVSGGGPHVLAFAGRHPDRVLAATIVVGLPRISDDEAQGMIELNRASHRLARDGDAEGLRELYAAPAQAMRADPLGAVRQMMAEAPASDHAIMADPAWQHAFAVGIREAFAQGVDGWVDEDLAFGGDWADIDLASVTASLTWWHGRADRNCPWSAAERLVALLPTAALRDLGNAGHLAPFVRDDEILEELLSRG